MAITEGTILRLVANLVFPDDVIMQNIFHFVLSSVVGDNDAEAVVIDAEEYIEDIYANYATKLDDEIVGSDLKVYEYDPIDDDWDEVGTGATTLGAGFDAEHLPHGCALVQNFFTLDPDIQGRKYWGGMTENSCVQGDWDASMVTAAVAAAVDVVTLFTATATANEYAPGVWSPKNKLFVLYSGSVATNTIVGYQRRRKPGVGI